MKKIIMLLIVLGLFSSLIPLVSGNSDYVIDDDTVYINDSNVYLSANPHTLNKSGWVEFQLNSKNYEGLIDVIFGFNTSNSKPISAEIWKNDNWNDLNRSFDVLNYDYQNFNKWFILNNVDINKNQLYKLRCFIYAKRGTDGKYFYGVKPSSETFNEAINNNHFYFIDPWWNITYEDIEGHWHLNESSGTVVDDASLNNNDGITQYMEDEDWVTGKLNNSLLFDGVNEHITMGNIANFDRTDVFSIDAWFKTDSTANQDIIARQAPATPYKGWSLNMNGGFISLYLINTYGSNQIFVYHATIAYNDNAWHHVIATYDGSSLASGVHIYIDNIDLSLTIMTDGLTASILNSNICSIGSRNGDLLYFDGNIDEVIIYNKELTHSQVSFRYNSGSGRESIELIIYGNPPDKPICIQPIDKTMNISIDTTLKTQVIDIDNDNMNVSFYLDDVLLENFNNISNNTIVESSNLSLEYSRIYSWYVVVEDETYTTQSNTFIFSTESEPEPFIPNVPPEKPILISPNNNYVNVSINTRLKAYIDDLDDYYLFTTFYWENNTLIDGLFTIVNYTVVSQRLNLDYNTTYSWYVITTDFIDYNISDIYSFTTESEPVEDDEITPPTPVELDYSILLLGICLAILVFVLEFLTNKLKTKRTKFFSVIELALLMFIIFIMIFLKFT